MPCTYLSQCTSSSVVRQPQAAAAMPADRVAGERFEPRIKLGAIDMHLGHVERAVEMRALAGRMPGGARGEFALFDQHDVAPAFERQMIEQADAHDAAANDNYPRMRFHLESLTSCLRDRWCPN